MRAFSAQLIITATAFAQPCTPAWQPGFSPPGTQNSSGCFCSDHPIYTAAVYDDDGPGPNLPALYIGGRFSQAGGTNASGIAKWTGLSWTRLGPQFSPDVIPETVRYLGVMGDESSSVPRMYAVGMFYGTESRVNCYNSVTDRWEVPGSAAVTGATPFTGTVFDDGSGSGPHLYIGGEGSFFSGTALGPCAKFNGTAWSSAAFPGGSVYSLRVLDPDAEGPEPSTIFAGASIGVFRLTGGSWTRVGPTPFNGNSVTSLSIFDEDGSGPHPPALFAAGIFSTMGGVLAQNIARWSGTAWSALGTGLVGIVARETSMRVLDDGSGPALYVGGSFEQAGGASRPGLAKWTGTAWADSAIGMPGRSYFGTPDGNLTAVTLLDEIPDALNGGVGTVLLAAGRFGSFAGVPTGNLALRRAGQWVPLGRGLHTDVSSLVWHDDGNGHALFAGSQPITGDRVGRLTSSGWQFVPSNITGTMNTMASHRFQGEPTSRLYVGGDFSHINGQSLACLARFHDGQWSSVPNRPNGAVYALESIAPPGFTSPLLVVGGRFQSAGSVALNNIGAFDGTSWIPFGSGVTATAPDASVRAAVIFNDNSGAPARLVVGGRFDRSDSVTLNNIGAWDGSQWQPLASGFTNWLTPPTVYALAVLDDDAEGPNPPRLYAAGDYLGNGPPGSISARFVRWNGSDWESPTPAQPNSIVYVLRVHDADGPAGPARPVLIVGGRFTNIGTAPYRGLAAFDGVNWSQLPAQSSSPLADPDGAIVYALVSTPPSAASSARLFVGGQFISAATLPSQSIAEFSGCPACPADFDASGVVDPADVARFVQVWLGSLSRPSLDGDFDGNAAVQPADVSLFVTRWFAAVNGNC